MKKQLLTILAGTLLLSSVAFAAENMPPMPKDMPLPPEGMPMDAEAPFLNGKEEHPAPHMMPKHFNPDEMKMPPKNHKEAFAERLNLTDEQKEKAAEIRKQGTEQMNAIMEEMKVLRQKARDVREKNKTEFESLLTPEQKEILEQMHQEQKEKMKKNKGNGKRGRGFLSPHKPVEK